jgi:crotonobetainyl-CoA:carnitine CoA-transferase CaiB-like acyl-CoA transferase
MIGISALQTSEYFGTGRTPRRLGSAHPRNAPYQAFRASDSYFVIAAGNDRLWREVCAAVGQAGLANDERFSTQEKRAARQVELAGILAPLFGTRSTREWLAEFDRRGVPCAAINSYPEILADPQVVALDLLRDLELPNGVRTRTTAFPMAISGFRFAIRRAPPNLGADNDEVAAEWLGAGSKP